jgi:SAM-dependent methyltransferase
MNGVLGMDALNQGAMRSAAGFYATLRDVEPGERQALTDIADQVRDKRILDLGVGGGRTVEALLQLSSNYVGVDYVDEMVMSCRRSFPGVRFEKMDARSMPVFPDGSFDLIMFSQQGICMVDHEGRMAILREAHRLLAPGGVFIFSTYNRNSVEHDQLFRFPELKISADIGKSLRSMAGFGWHLARRAFNRLRYRNRRISTTEYSIINDQCHDYGTMLYYITLDEQRKQLARVGFSGDVRVYDYSGRTIERDDGALGEAFLFVAKRSSN